MPSLKLYTLVSFLSFVGLVFIAAHPQSQFKEELNPTEFNKFLNGEHPNNDPDNNTDIENQPIHWLAAVICVNMGMSHISHTV